MIRSAALPSHFGGIAHFSHRPAISRASEGGSLLCSVPTNFLVPIVTVEGLSVLSRRAKPDTPSTVVSFSDADYLHLCIAQRVKDRRNLHEIWPRPCD